MRKWTMWVALVILVTWWQVQAGVARCGTVDGGVLLAPVVILTVALIKGVTRDLREVFEAENQRRVTNG